MLTPVGLLCGQHVFDSGTCAGVTVVTRSIHVVGENKIAIRSKMGIMGKPHVQHMFWKHVPIIDGAVYTKVK